MSEAPEAQGFIPDAKPWDYKERAIPLRTWCGSVVYKKKRQRFWTLNDLDRIQRSVQIIDYEPSFEHKLIQVLRNVSLELLGKILPFLSEEGVESLYDWIYALLGKIFNVAPLVPDNWMVIQIIRDMADRAGYDIKLTKRA